MIFASAYAISRGFFSSISMLNAAPKLLLLTAGYGDGHNSAAYALAQCAEARGWIAEVIDPCQKASPRIFSLTQSFYKFCVTSASWIWGITYYQTETADWSTKATAPILRKVTNCVKAVIDAEDGQFVEFARGDAADIRHEVVGNTVRIVAQQAGFMRADGVEISQQHGAEIGMRGYVIGQDSFDHNLGPSVGAGGLQSRHFLFIGMGIVGAVYRGGGGEDQLFAAGILHGFQQGEGAVDVVAVILKRHAYALADRLVSGKVNDGVDAVTREDALENVRAAVDAIEVGCLAGNLLDPVDDVCAGVGQIIDDDDIVTRVHELYDGVAADVSGASGDQYIHGLSLLIDCINKSHKGVHAFLGSLEYAGVLQNLLEDFADLDAQNGRDVFFGEYISGFETFRPCGVLFKILIKSAAGQNVFG